MLAAGEALLGRSLLGGFEVVAFLGVLAIGVLAIGVLFEFGWYVSSGTDVVTSQNPDHIPAAQARPSRQDVSPRP